MEHLIRLLKPIRAPSVDLPENVIPSAGVRNATFQSYLASAWFWCLRVSGAVAPSAPAQGRSLPSASVFPRFSVTGRFAFYSAHRRKSHLGPSGVEACVSAPVFPGYKIGTIARQR